MAHDYETYKLGDFALKNGGTIPDAHIAYKTFGDPANPAVIYPTWYSGWIRDNEWLVGHDKTLNPDRYFIIICALFGNGESSSPINKPDLRPWPRVLFYDNVRAQYELVTKKLGITHARCVLGWSMGAGQTFQWATQYPEFMDLIAPFCGAAKTASHNQAMLEGVKAAVLSARGASSAGICQGEQLATSDYRPWTQEEKIIGLKALGRVYSGWGFSQAFFRQKLYHTALGFETPEDFLKGFWEPWALSKDPEGMLAMLYTWQAGDCSAQEPYNGDFDKAMKGIKAKALVLPAQLDLYFRKRINCPCETPYSREGTAPEDSEIEVSHMQPGIGKCLPIPGVFGHFAGHGSNPEDVKFLDDALRDFFRSHEEQ